MTPAVTDLTGAFWHHKESMAEPHFTPSRLSPRLPGEHEPVFGFLKGLPILAGVFVFNSSQVGHNEAVLSAVAAALLLLVWAASGLWPRRAALISLICLGYGSLAMMLGALIVTLHMTALQLPTGLVLLPLSVPLFSSYWALSRVYRRAVLLALNLLYVALTTLVVWRVETLGYRDLNPLLVLSMSLVYVYCTHFTFFASTRHAVTEARLEERVQASRDPLTGLRNRRAFSEDYLMGLWHPGLPIGLLLLDIDHFKRVNDAHGHMVGDAVLVEASQRVEGVIGTRGRVYRWGGEEFAVLLPGWSAADLSGIAELLRDRVAGASFGTLTGLTASFGYGSVLPGDSREAAFDAVDLALRQAKEEGRNRARAAQNFGKWPERIDSY